MTIEQTLRQLVDALENCAKGNCANGDGDLMLTRKAIAAGRADLAQMAAPVAAAPDDREPVAWMVWAGVLDMRPHWPPYQTREEAERAASEIKSVTEVRALCLAAPAAQAAPVAAAVPERPMTLGEQVRDAQRVVSGWSNQKRDSVQLEGEGIQRNRHAQEAKPHHRTKAAHPCNSPLCEFPTCECATKGL